MPPRRTGPKPSGGEPPTTPPPPRRDYWGSNARRFALAAVTVSVFIGSVGWATDARHVLHGVLYGLGAAAVLPFLFVAAGLAAFALFAVAAALTGADGLEGLAGLGGEGFGHGLALVGPYYRFLARQRHPIVLGSVVGAVIGCVSLWLLIAALIAPKEAETARRLGQLQAQLEESVSTEGGFPPDSNGTLLGAASGDDGARAGAPAKDAFGREFAYHAELHGGTASYRLRSWGYDGVPSEDDLCVAGESSRAGRLLNHATDLAASVAERLTGDAVSWGDEVSAVRELRCAAGSSE